MHVCENCGGDFEILCTREKFIMSYAVEWVCKNCFEELEGCTFEEYGKEAVND